MIQIQKNNNRKASFFMLKRLASSNKALVLASLVLGGVAQAQVIGSVWARSGPNNELQLKVDDEVWVRLESGSNIGVVNIDTMGCQNAYANPSVFGSSSLALSPNFFPSRYFFSFYPSSTATRRISVRNPVLNIDRLGISISSNAGFVFTSGSNTIRLGLGQWRRLSSNGSHFEVSPNTVNRTVGTNLFAFAFSIGDECGASNVFVDASRNGTAAGSLLLEGDYSRIPLTAVRTTDSRIADTIEFTFSDINPVKRYNMVKTASVASVSVPSKITYTFAFTNNGSSKLFNLAVADNDIDRGTLACQNDNDNNGGIDSLDVGETLSCTAERSINQAQIDSGIPIINTAVPTAKDGQGEEVQEDNDADSLTPNDVSDNTATVVVSQQSSYNMTKTVSPVEINSPGVVTYTFTFANNGDSTLSNLTVIDANIDPNTLFCNGDGKIDILPAGDIQICTAQRTITQLEVNNNDVITNTAIPSAEDRTGNVVAEDDDGNNATPNNTTDNTAVVKILNDPPMVFASLGNVVEINSKNNRFPVLGSASDPQGGDSIDRSSVVLHDVNSLQNTGSVGNDLITDFGTYSVDNNGVVSFTPVAGLVTEAVDILFSVADVKGLRSNQAKLGIRVVNSKAPVAVSDTVTYRNGEIVTINVLANDQGGDIPVPATVGLLGGQDSDNNGSLDRLVVSGEGSWSVNPSTGEVSFAPDIELRLAPTPVQYTVDDGDRERSNPADITLDLLPAARDDSASYTLNNAVNINVVGNDNEGDIVIAASLSIIGGLDSDSNGSLDTLEVSGQGVWKASESGVITFTPEQGFAENPDVIRYTVNDKEANVSNQASVTVSFGMDDPSPVPAAGLLGLLVIMGSLVFAARRRYIN